MALSNGVDAAAALFGILKRYDRIGFGRRGVLDAEHDIRRFAAEVPDPDRTQLQEIVLTWIEPAEAERVVARLHYNLAEHLQALAITLCGTLPIEESQRVLRRLHRERAFESGNDPRREALQYALIRLGSVEG